MMPCKISKHGVPGSIKRDGIDLYPGKPPLQYRRCITGRKQAYLSIIYLQVTVNAFEKTRGIGTLTYTG